MVWIARLCYVFEKRRYKPSSVASIVAGLQLFFSMNDKVLNWDKEDDT
jgi:hypothetical protein